MAIGYCFSFPTIVQCNFELCINCSLCSRSLQFFVGDSNCISPRTKPTLEWLATFNCALKNSPHKVRFFFNNKKENASCCFSRNRWGCPVSIYIGGDRRSISLWVDFCPQIWSEFCTYYGWICPQQIADKIIFPVSSAWWVPSFEHKSRTHRTFGIYLFALSHLNCSNELM